jgi:hypothetical protein
LGERLDRTQEVGGSSPPSSIPKQSCTDVVVEVRAAECAADAVHFELAGGAAWRPAAAAGAVEGGLVLPEGPIHVAPPLICFSRSVTGAGGP